MYHADFPLCIITARTMCHLTYFVLQQEVRENGQEKEEEAQSEGSTRD